MERGQTNAIATVLTGTDPAEDERTARLLAAAPELLSALSALIDECGGEEHPTFKTFGTAQTLVQKFDK